VTLRVHPDDIISARPNGVLSIHPSWSRVRLCDVADVLNGFAFSSSRFGAKGDIPLIRIRDVGRTTTDTHYSGSYGLEYVVQPGSVLVGMDGEFRVARWPGPPALLNQRVCKVSIRDSGAYDDRFLRWVLPGYLDAVHRHTSSVTAKHLSSETVKQLPLPLPPRAEQERIVAAIEEQFSRLDAGVAALGRVRQDLRRMRAAVLQAAVTGRLVPTTDNRVAIDELLRSLRQARVQKRVRRGSVEAPTRMVPDTWDWVPFADLTIGFDGRRVPVKSSDRARRHGPYRYYGAQGIIDHIDDFRFDGEHVLIAEDGANLASRTQPIAFVVRGQFWVNNHAHVVQPRSGVLSEYLALALNADPLRGSVTGTAQPKLTAAALNGLLVPLPSTEEQQRIVSEVERQTSLIDSLNAAVSSTTERATGLSSSILAAAFGGHLVPQDPNDEPASATLARIAATRASSITQRATTPRARRTKVTAA